MSWSSGKDSALALHEVLRDDDIEVAGLLVTMNATHDRVAMHAVRRALLEQQAAALGVPLHLVQLPWPCPNNEYERLMSSALAAARSHGVDTIVFGDLFLADIRAYREQQLAGTGFTPLFPLWQRPTRELAEQMLDVGISAVLTCVDPQRLAPSYAGRRFDRALLDQLPADVDPCGENGEFHTFVDASPDFTAPLDVLARWCLRRSDLCARLVLVPPRPRHGR